MWLARVRTSGPLRPSGRRFGSIGKIMPSGVVREHTAIRPVASFVAVRSAASTSLAGAGVRAGRGRPGPSPAGAATKMTSTSLA